MIKNYFNCHYLNRIDHGNRTEKYVKFDLQNLILRF